MPDAERLVPQLAERARAAIHGLERTLMSDHAVPARNSPSTLDLIQVVTTPTEIRLEAQKGHLEAALLRSTSTEGAREF